MINNILAAKNVLPAQGWRVFSIFGREFVLSDLKALIDLGSGDQSFTWERELMPSSYFESLIHFRLKHYQKYGFGVHGVWMDGNLIGQCGLQVLNEELDRVECAIFLGKAFTHQGLGSTLARHLVSRCKECGMTAFYGVARPDNPESIALVRKLGGIPLETTLHFSREATIFRVDITNEVK